MPSHARLEHSERILRKHPHARRARNQHRRVPPHAKAGRQPGTPDQTQPRHDHHGRARDPGRHELGQSFLVDRRAIATITDLVAATDGPILEIGPGDGAITRPMARLGRPIRAIELDRRRAVRLDTSTPSSVRVEVADAVTHRFDRTPHVVVANLPFHITTTLLRRLLHAPGWTDAVLVAQWEVARRRAGVGGGSQLTAQAAPWFTFTLHQRIPRGAFRPAPQVDAGLFSVRRRERPLVPVGQRRAFERLVADVFRAPGGSLPRILERTGALPAAAARRWQRERSHAAGGLPRDLGAEDWADLWRRHRASMRASDA